MKSYWLVFVMSSTWLYVRGPFPSVSDPGLCEHRSDESTKKVQERSSVEPLAQDTVVEKQEKVIFRQL
ncbi:hypothetical protein ATANTOWER_002648 [Ataeniobius toweri]|uniref:Uncharacterized protein n=1 Tax=Ataeniobius toweri TaxID=208326 RepID=A0ABU7A4M6_9TELE|nr:hypothetical protein [Ataeniobius toweri]